MLDEHEIVSPHQTGPENNNGVLWAPWDVITRMQQEGGHDNIFPSVVLRRIPVWAGSVVDKDISTAASRVLPRQPSAARMFRFMPRRGQQAQKRKAPTD